MGMCVEGGCEVSFWWVPRAWNTEADQAAKAAANDSGRVVEYIARKGILV
jgi:hypothetical protein